MQQKRKTIFDKLQSFSDSELDKIINDYKDLKNSIFGNKQYISNFRGRQQSDDDKKNIAKATAELELQQIELSNIELKANIANEISTNRIREKQHKYEQPITYKDPTSPITPTTSIQSPITESYKQKKRIPEEQPTS